MYISLYRPDDPRRVGNLKLRPLRGTPVIINLTNLQLYHRTSFGSTGGRSWGSPNEFLTTPTTNITNVLLVISGVGLLSRSTATHERLLID